MTDEQKVAPELMEALERLMRYAPPEVANDEQVRNSILIYLKLGGERLARQYFQIIQKAFLEKIVLIKKRPPDEPDESDKDTEDTDDADDADDADDVDDADDADDADDVDDADDADDVDSDEVTLPLIVS